jgi:hypothetical protein
MAIAVVVVVLVVVVVVVVVVAAAGKMLMMHAGLDSNTTFVLPLLPPAVYDAGLLHALRVMTLRRLSHGSGVTSECAQLFDVIVKRQPHVVMVEEEGGEEWVCFGRKTMPPPSSASSAYGIVLRIYDVHVTKSSLSSAPSSLSAASLLILKDLPTFDVQRLRPRSQQPPSSPLPPAPHPAAAGSPIATIVGVYTHHRSHDTASKVWFASVMMGGGGGNAVALQVTIN